MPVGGTVTGTSGLSLVSLSFMSQQQDYTDFRGGAMFYFAIVEKSNNFALNQHLGCILYVKGP